MTETLKPYSQFSRADLDKAIHDAYRDLKKLELSEHPRAVWSASVLRQNIHRLEVLL